MAAISRRRFAREVVRLLVAQPSNQAKIVQQVAAYAIEHRLTGQLDLLMKDIADELFLQQNHVTAEVEHVFDLSAATRDAITTLLTQTTGAKSVELETRQNSGLIGGVVVRTPRQELDASVQTQLKQIAGGIK